VHQLLRWLPCPSAVLALALLVGCAEGPEARENRPGDPQFHREEGEEAEAEGADPDAPDGAFRWRRLRWVDQNGQIPPGALQRAWAQRQATIDAHAHTRDAGISPTSWTARGPTNVGGRTRSLLVSPDDPRRLWAGSVGGGIWTTTDGGSTWAPTDDRLPSLAIGCLARDPQNPAVMYAGTGEGFFNLDAVGGVGIYKTVDSGATWNLLPSTAGWDNVCRIAISPTRSNVLLASKRYGGLLRSTDGGASWSTVRWAQGSFDVAFDPTDDSKAVAQIIDHDTNWFHAALYSTDGGVTWTPAAGLSHVSGFDGRIEIAYAPSDSSIVYASVATGGGRIWRSTDGGRSYTLRTTSGASGCNWYANPLWVDPTNPDFLLTGGTAVFKSTDGGATLTQISDGYILTEQPHPDIHNFVSDSGFDGATNRRVYVCSDGGVHRTDNIYTAATSGQGGGWVSLSAGYRTSQFYGAAGDGPTGRLVGGTQDNGTLFLQTGSNSATLPFGGDGGFCAMDPTSSNYSYGEYIYLQIHRASTAGGAARYIYNGIADAGVAANFIAPFVLDPSVPTTMFAGGLSLWRSTNVRAGTPTWQAVRPPHGDVISAIAVAPSRSDVVWVGQNNGVVSKTTNATAPAPTWIDIDTNAAPTNPFPNRYVTRILIDKDNPSIVYVALGGFSPDNLWRTADGGSTWQRVTGGGATALPAAPIYGLARHPGRPTWIYAATEVGVFASADSGATWSTTNDGPANVCVDEIVFLNRSNTLLAATHGRGLFTAPVIVCQADFNADDRIDINDFLAFLQEYSAGSLHADLTGNGAVEVQDFLAFVALYASACT
jgi:photosystem II stability/assembly factor-like uncharacterized protein